MEKSTKKSKVLIPSENQIQMAIFEWSRHYPILQKYMFCNPQGVYEKFHRLTDWQQAFLSRMGLKAGITDICILYPVDPFHGFLLEAKRKYGVISPAQKEFRDNVILVGYRHHVAYSIDEGIDSIKEYMGEHLRD